MSDADNKRELVSKLRALALARFGPGDQRKKLFRAYDADHDGQLTASELARMLEDARVGNGFTRGSWVQGIMQRLDHDQSGGLTYAELDKAIRESAAATPPRSPSSPSAPAESRELPRWALEVIGQVVLGVASGLVLEAYEWRIVRRLFR